MDTCKKQRWEETEKRREEKKKEDQRVRRKKIQDCEKVENTVFPIFWGSRGSKSRLADAAGAEPSGQMRDDMSLWREAHFEVKMLNIFHAWTTFGS